jgi:hypothetical protein
VPCGDDTRSGLCGQRKVACACARRNTPFRSFSADLSVAPSRPFSPVLFTYKFYCPQSPLRFYLYLYLFETSSISRSIKMFCFEITTRAFKKTKRNAKSRDRATIYLFLRSRLPFSLTTGPPLHSTRRAQHKLLHRQTILLPSKDELGLGMTEGGLKPRNLTAPIGSAAKRCNLRKNGLRDRNRRSSPGSRSGRWSGRRGRRGHHRRRRQRHQRGTKRRETGDTGRTRAHTTRSRAPETGPGSRPVLASRMACLTLKALRKI